MDFFYLFFLAFFLIFLSELGDKTQILVLSFSSKLNSFRILLGVALGSFFSHGIAILFGSAIANFENPTFHLLLQFATYLSFLFFGIITLLQKENRGDSDSQKKGLLSQISGLPISYILIIAFSIAIGEIGDKTFLASLGLGVSYPTAKCILVLGAVLGMVASDSIAILFGKCLNHVFHPKTMQMISGGLFLLFGMYGFVSFFINL